MQRKIGIRSRDAARRVASTNPDDDGRTRAAVRSSTPSSTAPSTRKACAVARTRCRSTEAVEAMEQTADGFVWIGVHNPSKQAVEAVAERFDLHPLAVEDAIHAHQRPKLEVHGDVLFAVLKTARYVDSEELVEIGEVMCFVGQKFVVTVRHGEAAAARRARRARGAPDTPRDRPERRLLRRHRQDRRRLRRRARRPEVDVSQIEDRSSAARCAPIRRSGSTAQARGHRVQARARTARPPLQKLAEGRVRHCSIRAATSTSPTSATTCLRDGERLHNIDELLTSVLHANLTQLTMQDNKDMRRISASSRSSRCRRWSSGSTA